MLLALAGEVQSRAAKILARHGLDENAILRRWPQLRRTESVGEAEDVAIPTGVQAALAATAAHLSDLPQPIVLATEHLLLAVLRCEHEAAAWLSEAGLRPPVA